jgi:phosphonate transport system substrate-binding protein
MKRLAPFGDFALVLILLAFVIVGAGCASRSQYVRVSLQPSSVATATPSPFAGAPPLRVAVATVISPRGTVESYSLLFDYLSEKLGRPIEVIQRGTYAEVNDLIRTGDVDMAFICTYAYVEGHRHFGMELLATPQVNGKATYQSYLIVPADSDVRSILDLRGRTFAFTDPMSHTGRFVPTWLLRQYGERPEAFFSRIIYTYSHDNSINAVATRLVDGAAVDSLVYEFAVARAPEIAEKTRIIWKSPPYAAPPVVVPPGLDPKLKHTLRRVLLTAHLNSDGQKALAALQIDRFVVLDDSAYDSVRQVAEAVGQIK